MSRFTNKEILKKIQKIRALIDRGVDGEAQQAQRTLDKILEKYELDESVLEERELIRIPHAWEMRHVVKHIAWSLELEVFTGGRWKDKLFINATPSEENVFNEVWSQVRKVYLLKKKQMDAQLQGFMTGFLDRSYPVPKEEPTCSKCEKVLQFNRQERRYECSCGYKGKKLKIRLLDADSYASGAAASGKFLN